MGQLFKIFIIALGLYYFFRLIGRAIMGNNRRKSGDNQSRNQEHSSNSRDNSDDDDEYVDYEEIE